MSSILPPAINELIDTLAKLPGVGPKMASRVAFYLLQKGKDDITNLTRAIEGITSTLSQCHNCGLITDQELCPICRNYKRKPDQICVVEDSLDVVAFERANSYAGVYHVLGGVLSPIDGIGPDQLRIKQLVVRVEALVSPPKDSKVEVILAMNPSLEGEATANYLYQELSRWLDQVIITRIARGLPMGSDVEYADPTTLVRALEGRQELEV